MEPNFAMLFDDELFALVHRARGGNWVTVGHVGIDRPDHAAKTRILFRKASRLCAGGIATKLMIPNSEITYVRCEAPGPGEDARVSQIRDALVRWTGQEAGDFQFDWLSAGNEAQVAIVHRQTLAEAETFANERGFNPVSFGAIPEVSDFAREVDFGASQQYRQSGLTRKTGSRFTGIELSAPGIASYFHALSRREAPDLPPVGDMPRS